MSKPLLHLYSTPVGDGKMQQPVQHLLLFSSLDLEYENNWEMNKFPSPRSRLRICLAKRVRPSRPTSACSFSILRLNLALTHGIPRDFRGGVHLYISPSAIRHVRGQGNVHFPCPADHEQDWQPYPVDPYSAICDDHTYIHTYIHTVVV